MITYKSLCEHVLEANEDEWFMSIKGIIFDLDGVIVSTDEYHYQAWQQLADEENIYFDRHINERLRGVSRMASLDILLEKSQRQYTDAEKNELAARKNGYYRLLLGHLGPADILPGAMDFISAARQKGIKVAVGSSSRNSPFILERIGLSDYFDATSDGNDITNSKPDPEVFLIAAERMQLKPQQCLVVEDAAAGIEAAIAAGMFAMAVGTAACDKRAHIHAPNLASITFEEILKLLP
jgi:beta-phosphoglucomutase